MDEISKSGQFQGSTPHRRDPRQRRRSTPRRGQEGGLDKPRVCRGIAELRCGEGLHPSVAVLRHGVATVHCMEIFVFCFVLLFCYSEDLSIGLMRTL